jgi:hypothetical protein
MVDIVQGRIITALAMLLVVGITIARFSVKDNENLEGIFQKLMT